MNVLAIMGSPRNKKNNDTLIDHMLLGLHDPSIKVEKLSVKDLNVKPCIACDACARNLGCIFNDDMAVLYKKFNNADAIIISSPLYFNSISAQLKAIIDRCQAIWSSKYVLKQSLIDISKYRVGYFICTAGMPKSPDLFAATIPIMDLFFKSTNCEYMGNLFVADIDSKPVIENQAILNNAFEIGSELKKRLKG